MNIGQLIAGVQFTVKHAVDRYFIQGRRQRLWAKKQAPFVHKNADGLKFQLHPPEFVDHYIYQHGYYEHRFLKTFTNRFPEGAIALDIGANIGNHAICLSNSFREIHAFEPNPRVLSRLMTNVNLNEIKNIIVHDVGLGKKSSILPFRENNDGNLGASGFIKASDDLKPLSTLLELKIEHADAYISELKLPRIDFIKIDVEGWEPDLFEGMTNTIERYRPIIAFEFHGQTAEDGDYDLIISKLPNYIIVEPKFVEDNSNVLAKILWDVRRMGNATFLPIGRPECRTYENILAFPDEASLNAFSQH